jgi:hypothetical protein
MISQLQTAGRWLNWHPHIHAICTYGGITIDRSSWIDVYLNISYLLAKKFRPAKDPLRLLQRKPAKTFRERHLRKFSEDPLRCKVFISNKTSQVISSDFNVLSANVARFFYQKTLGKTKKQRLFFRDDDDTMTMIYIYNALYISTYKANFFLDCFSLS